MEFISAVRNLMVRWRTTKPTEQVSHQTGAEDRLLSQLLGQQVGILELEVGGLGVLFSLGFEANHRHVPSTGFRKNPSGSSWFCTLG